MKKTGLDSVDSWFITMRCFIISMIIYAVVRLSGVLFVSSMVRYQVDRQSASMPYLLCDFIQAISSPITGYFSRKFGVRPVMIFGCLLSSIGIGACYFAESIETVDIFWGIVFGFGFALSCPLLAVVITQHFARNRATAMGIVYVGGYIGYALLPTISEYLMDDYGLSGTFLFLSALMLHCVPAAMLLRQPDLSVDKQQNLDFLRDRNIPLDENKKLPCESTKFQATESKIQNIEVRVETIPGLENHINSPSNGFKGKINNAFEIENVVNSSKCSSINKKETSEICMPINEFCDQQKVDFPPVAPNPEGLSGLNATDSKLLENVQCMDIAKIHENLPPDVSSQTKNDFNDQKTKELSSSHNSNMSGYQNEKRNITGINSEVILMVKSDLALKKDTKSPNAFKVFLEPIFFLILVTEAVFEGSFIAFVTIIVDFSMDVGLPLSDGKYALLGFAVASSIGLVSFGWVTDGGYMTLTNFSGLLFLCRGIIMAILPFSNGLAMLIILVVLQGFSEASLSNLFPLIIAEYYNDYVHEMAISCRLFLCAPVYLVTPFLIGYFRDGLGSYFYLFYMVSMLCLVSGVSLFLAPFLAKFRCVKDETILRIKSRSQS